ncbi:MAG TPA: hypothetical protein VHY08_08445, partial [Bacillota bacterium]|nr:hypothetical protein [Bacillota bacterium]
RYALENKKSLADIAAFMQDSEKNYAVNHLIVFSDPVVSKVLENNISGIGTTGNRVQRALRTSDSRLNKGVSWGIPNAIASVNSFLLYGNRDNHRNINYNTRRWKYIKQQLTGRKKPVTPEDMKSIMSYCNGTPSPFSNTKYLYNKATLYMVIFQPDTLELEVYFFPRHTLNVPAKPVFERISVF